ncbi:hypothetical protein [Pseudomonas guariconensis]|uniref:hypothetical protein n=1 Tax=Pseudomonas guariconensis TaxID=1288410 RepID=UPI002FE5DE0E
MAQSHSPTRPSENDQVLGNSSGRSAEAVIPARDVAPQTRNAGTLLVAYEAELAPLESSLNREIPVLLQSALGEGQCISAVGTQNVEMTNCNSNDARQM